MSSRKLRVAVVSDAVYPWHTGGKETRYRELLSRLSGHDIEITVYTMRWWEGEPPARPIRHRAISRKHEMYTSERRSMRQSILFALACLKLVFIGRFDVIEADHMPYLQLFPLRVVASIRRVPLVVTWHELWGKEYWERYLGGVPGRIAAQIEHAATRLPDHITAVSSGTADQLIASGVPAEKISVMWAGVNVSELDLIEAAANAPDVLFSGRLISHKRVDIVLHAVAQLASQGDNFTLAITGDGPERERLGRLATELGVDHLVTFHGEVPESSTVWALMKGAKVFAFPSEREGFGLAVAESLASGTPVVVVEHPSNASRALVDDGITGSVVAPGDVEAFAAALRFWVTHPNEHHMQGLRFEERHPHLSWDGLAERYGALLYEVGR